MKSMCIYRIVVLALLVQHPLVSYAQDDVVGIVSRIKGDLVHRVEGRARVLRKMDTLGRNSVIELAEGTKRGWVEILTSNGPVRYSRFPVSGFMQLAGLPVNMQKHYRMALGGKVLGTRGGIRGKKTSEELFDWSMDLGALYEEDVNGGFSLVLSETRSSRQTGALVPLYFKLREGTKVTEAKFVVSNRRLGTVVKEGQLEKAEGEWIFRFDCFDYETDLAYRVRCDLTLSDGENVQWEFAVKILGKEDMDYIEEEVQDILRGNETEFQENMVRAAVLRSYSLKLTALQVLASAGLDVGEALE